MGGEQDGTMGERRKGEPKTKICNKERVDPRFRKCVCVCVFPSVCLSVCLYYVHNYIHTHIHMYMRSNTKYACMGVANVATRYVH